LQTRPGIPHAVEAGVDAQVLLDRQPVRKVDVRRREVETRQDPVPVLDQIFAQNLDLTRGRDEKSEQHRQGGGLARAIAAQQRGDAAALDGEGDAVHCPHVAVLLRKPFDDDGRRGRIIEHEVRA